jgi:hypothetical protein
MFTTEAAGLTEDGDAGWSRAGLQPAYGGQEIVKTQARFVIACASLRFSDLLPADRAERGATGPALTRGKTFEEVSSPLPPLSLW